MAEDPLAENEPFRLPPKFFHLRKYLASAKWPLNQYAPLELKVTLFERRVARRIDDAGDTDKEFPKWSRLDTSNSIPNVFKADGKSLFTVKAKDVKTTMENFRNLNFPIGTDNFKPFEGMVFNLNQSVPRILVGKLALDDVYATLRTERAFMGQIFHNVDSIRTPEAYKEILKLIDLKGIAQRLMVKSTLALLARLADCDQQDINPYELMDDWRVNFKEKLVMLFVNTFLLSAEKEFLDGTIFQESLRIKTADQWKAFAMRVKDTMLQLRDNRAPEQYYEKLRLLIEKVKESKPNFKKGLVKVWEMLQYQFNSPKPVNQCLEQLAQVVSSVIFYTEKSEIKIKTYIIRFGLYTSYQRSWDTSTVGYWRTQKYENVWKGQTGG